MTAQQSEVERKAEEWTKRYYTDPDLESIAVTAYLAGAREAAKWRKYPEEKPEERGWYAVQNTQHKTVVPGWWTGFEWDMMHPDGVIAWTSLPLKG